MSKRVLIFRLSSLGDVILSLLALPDEKDLPPNHQYDFVIGAEYQELVTGHPSLSKIHAFDRGQGFLEWTRFCKRLFDLDYEEVWDLHKSLRTKWARILFWFWGIKKRRAPKWKLLPREKLKFYGLISLKKLWPSKFYPRTRALLFSSFSGSPIRLRPTLSHWLKEESNKSIKGKFESIPKDFVAVMPSSRWKGKVWPVEYWVNLILNQKVFPVILGTKADETSLLLSETLAKRGIPSVSMVGKLSLKENALLLSRAKEYWGLDTGLAHLAEAVGTRVKVIYGPTWPEQGFGPWRPDSQTASLRLWCSPCGKDGRFCFRGEKRYCCLSDLTPREVMKQWEGS